MAGNQNDRRSLNRESETYVSFLERFYKMSLKAEHPRILEQVMGFDCSMENWKITRAAPRCRLR
ncbi:MAG: hypothetical protein LBS02_20040 [Hungatella sp.]|nr:hypothetical protein [Hungatella sp.]